MINEEDFLKAKETIRLYKEQQEKLYQEAKKKREERYQGCDHEYQYTNRTWGPITEQECIYCGHRID